MTRVSADRCVMHGNRALVDADAKSVIANRCVMLGNIALVSADT